MSKNAEVWLATDEDQEGEAIFGIYGEVLNLDKDKTKRIVFNEITFGWPKQAVANPRTWKNNLFYAQQARRILDRVVGFELSPVFGKNLDDVRFPPVRVQSVAVRLVVEQEREINNFLIRKFYKVKLLILFQKIKRLKLSYPTK